VGTARPNDGTAIAPRPQIAQNTSIFVPSAPTSYAPARTGLTLAQALPRPNLECPAIIILDRAPAETVDRIIGAEMGA